MTARLEIIMNAYRAFRANHDRLYLNAPLMVADARASLEGLELMSSYCAIARIDSHMWAIHRACLHEMQAIPSGARVWPVEHETIEGQKSRYRYLGGLIDECSSFRIFFELHIR